MFRRVVHIALAAAVCGGAITLTAEQKPKPAPKPKASAEDRAKALENYQTTCQPCHGPEGKAPLKEMDLADGEWKHGSTPAAIAKTIREGVPGTAMVAFKDKFSDAEVRQLAALVGSFGKAPAKKK